MAQTDDRLTDLAIAIGVSDRRNNGGSGGWIAWFDHIVLLSLLVLPWLWPIAQNPTPSVQPLLFGLACVGLLCLALGSNWAAPTLRNLWGVWLLACLWMALRSSHWPEAVLTTACLLGVVLCASLASLIGARMLAQAWLWAACISAVIGLIQYAGWAGHLSPWINSPGDTPGQAFGNLRQRNQLATLLSLGLVAWGYLQMTTKRSVMDARRAANTAGSSLGARMHVMAPAALMTVVLAATASRTGMLQLLFLCAAALLWTRGAVWRWVLGLSLIYGAASVALPWLLTSSLDGMVWLRTPGSEGCSNRTVLWHNALDLSLQRPWDGWGWRGLAQAHYSADFADRFCSMLDHTHNFLLQLSVELGIPFALAVLVVILIWLLRAKPWLERAAPKLLAWGVLAVIGIHSLLEYPLWYAPFQMAAGFALGILLLPLTVSYKATRSAVLMGLALLGGSLYAAWDYWRVSQLYVAPAARADAYREDTYNKVKNSVLFDNQVNFYYLLTTTVTRENASQMERVAQQLMRFSPEPAVVERWIEALILQNQTDKAKSLARHYESVHPRAYADWLSSWSARQCPDLPPCFSNN